MQHGACWQRTLRMLRHSQTTHNHGIQAAMSMSAFNHIDISQSLNGIPRVRDSCEFDGTTTTVRQRLIGRLLWPCIGIELRGIGTQSLAERVFRNGCNLNRGLHYVSLASWSCNCDDRRTNWTVDISVFDNWRMLHGRSAFTGKRRMCGGYSTFVLSYF